MPGGRPTKYKPEYCKRIVEHMADGYPLVHFAVSIGVAQQSLHDWAKKYPEFSEAMKMAKQAFEAKLYEIGLQGTFADKFNTGPYSLLAKNYLGWSDRQTVDQKTEHSGGLNITIKKFARGD